MAARKWTCRRCGVKVPRIKPKCECGGKRPAPRKPKHARVLDEMPYEEWVELYGERCGICGRERSEQRRLDRDHDHKTGRPRGLLCHRCNRALPDWIGLDWLRSAVAYLERAHAAVA